MGPDTYVQWVSLPSTSSACEALGKDLDNEAGSHHLGGGQLKTRGLIITDTMMHDTDKHPIHVHFGVRIEIEHETSSWKTCVSRRVSYR